MYIRSVTSKLKDPIKMILLLIAFLHVRGKEVMNNHGVYVYLAVLLFMCLGAGCGSLINKKMASWDGHHYSDMIASWGPPQQVLDDGTGGKIFVYTAVRSFTSPGQANTRVTGSAYGVGNYAYGSATGVTTYTPPQTSSYGAHRMFWVNSSGYIYRWAWKGL